MIKKNQINNYNGSKSVGFSFNFLKSWEICVNGERSITDSAVHTITRISAPAISPEDKKTISPTTKSEDITRWYFSSFRIYRHGR